MRTVYSIESEKEPVSSTLEFMNAFGAVFNESVLIHEYNPRVSINFERIKRAEIRKKRNFRINLILSFMALAFFLITVLSNFSLQVKFFLGISALLAVASAILFHQYNYRFLINCHHNIIELEVKHYLKEDAKKILKLINKNVNASRKR